MDGEREPVHPASMPVDCTSSKRETLQAWPRRWVERAQNALVPGKVEGEPTARISSPASTLSRRRTLAKSHILSLLPFIVHNMVGSPPQCPPPGSCPYAQLSISAIRLLLGQLVMGPGDELSGSGYRKSWTQMPVPVFIRRATTCKLLEFFVPLLFFSDYVVITAPLRMSWEQAREEFGSVSVIQPVLTTRLV